MILIYAIFIVFVVYSFSNRRKSILAYFPISLLFTTVPLAKFGNTFIGLNFVWLIMIYAIYFLTKRKKLVYTNPFSMPIWGLIIGFTLSFIFGSYRSSVYPFIQMIMNYAYVLILWNSIDKHEDIVFIIKVFVKVFYIICLYTIIEFILGENIWMEWLQVQTQANIYASHHDDIRLGFARCNSFFHFPIPLGDACAIIFCFFLYIKMNFMVLNYSNKKMYFIYSLLIIALILSNSRAPLVAFIIGLMFLDFFKNFRNISYTIILLFIVGIFAGDYILNMIKSMTGDFDQDVGGSSMGLREAQLAYCINEFNNSPIFGAGFNRLGDLQDASNRELAGAESQLFVLLVSQGICGIITYAYACVKMLFSLRPFGKLAFKYSVTFTLMWIAADIISLTTGLYITYPMILLLIIIKSYLFDKRKKNEYIGVNASIA